MSPPIEIMCELKSMLKENCQMPRSLDPSLIVLAYGQSNAEMYVVGPRPASPLLNDERVVTLTTGVGLRGYKYEIDGSRKVGGGEFFFDNRRLQAAQLEDTHPMARHETRSSSILHAAGSRLLHDRSYRKIYVRASGKAGLRLVGVPHPVNAVTGIYKNHCGNISPILTSVLENARDFNTIAQRNGEHIDKAYILFIHGEADRSTPTAQYLESFGEAKEIIDRELREIGVEPHWLVTQAGGTDHTAAGNDWGSRLAAESFLKGTYENLTFLAPLYPYALHDKIHHDADAKALIGEIAAIAIRDIEEGRPWQTPLQ